MPRTFAPRFAKPSVLRTIHPPLLVDLLSPNAIWLERQGVSLARPPDKLDYEALSLALIGAHGDVPADLLERICLIDDMAGDRMEDQLRALAAKLKVSIGEKDVNADIAV